MNRTKSAILILSGISLGLAALGCQPGGVGDPCIPEDEYEPGFSGYGVGEVNVESRSFQCETRVCLVNHFRGRVSCPYGQTQEQIDTLGEGDGLRCRLPDGRGEGVSVPVEPQLTTRMAKDAVYCSCRCAGPDKNARYCDCPSGFSCVKLNSDLGLGKGQLAGSYCVKNKTRFEPIDTGGAPCVASSGNCPSETAKNPRANP